MHKTIKSFFRPIRLVYYSEMFIIERMMSSSNMFSLSPEQLLILLEEKIESGEINVDQLKELLK